MRNALTTMTLAALLAAAPAARAACPQNPLGGPNRLVLTVPGTGSDIDIGWKGDDFHNLPIPEGSTIELCAHDCDLATDHECIVDGGDVTVAGVPFGPPTPLMAGTTASACLLISFTDTPLGTADVEHGDISVGAGLQGAAYVTLFPIMTTKICPRCAGGAGIGTPGTCDSGLGNGQACTVEDIITVSGTPAGADPVYPVSRDCLPSGAATGTVSFNVTLSTDMQSLDTPCPSQSTLHNCGAGTCTGACGAGADNGGVTQVCCSNNANRPCFPDPIDRSGAPGVPAPQWPNLTYPKSGTATLVAAFCSSATGNILVDPTIGLPGPVALIAPVSHTWDGNAAPSTTTSTSTSTSTSSTTSTSTSSSSTTSTSTSSTTTTSTSTSSTTIPGQTTSTSTSTSSTTTTSTSVPTTTSTSSTTTTSTSSTTLPGQTTTTATSSSTTTTSTTLAPGTCASAADCDDDDPCTEDACAAGACQNTQLSGVDGALCEVNQARAPLCEPIDPALQSVITTKLDKVTTLLGRAATATGGKQQRLLNKARKNLKMIDKKTTKALNKGLIDATCAAAIGDAVAAVRAAIDAIVQP